MPSRCEDCALKVPSFGLPAEGRARWCSGCAKAHAGARDLVNKRCEDCALKFATCGLPAEGRKRWCGGCAKAHAGAQSLSKRRLVGPAGAGVLGAARTAAPARRLLQLASAAALMSTAAAGAALLGAGCLARPAAAAGHPGGGYLPWALAQGAALHASIECAHAHLLLPVVPAVSERALNCDNGTRASASDGRPASAIATPGYHRNTHHPTCSHVPSVSDRRCARACVHGVDRYRDGGMYATAPIAAGSLLAHLPERMEFKCGPPWPRPPGMALARNKCGQGVDQSVSCHVS